MKYTKQYFQNLMLDILDPLKSYYSKGCARLNIGRTIAHYDPKAAHMEAFSRPLWGLTAFWAGGGREPEPDIMAGLAAGALTGSRFAERAGDMGSAAGLDFARIYRKGLAAGTDPESPEYWGECDDFDQRFVEMAAMAYGIMYARPVVWDPLSEKEKTNLAAYLGRINRHPLPVCNWIMFAVLVNIALREVGYPYSEELLEKYMNGLEEFYIGDGWYRDGDSNQKDYYVSFAIHFYSLIYADRLGVEQPVRAARYKERAMLFAKQFIYWFDDRGAALPFGRSLTYRFAQVSFFSACLIAGIEPFPVDVMKGLIVRNLEYWLSKPIFDKNGLLTIGYEYPNLAMAERYNAFGSPYWCMKTFGFLMLPDSHPFWKAEPAPYPKLPAVCPMPCADMYVRHYGSHTTAFVPGVYSRYGHGQIVAKYGKFAYDTRCGICISKSEYELHENAPDSMLAFFIDGYVYVRRICEDFRITEEGVWSRWSPYPGITVETTVLPDASGHRRIHRITGSVECEAWDCGFSVDRGETYESGAGDTCGESCAASPGADDRCITEVDGTSATVRSRDTRCTVTGSSGEGYILYPDPNLNIIYPKVAIPCVKYHIRAGESTLETRVELEIR